ncbi:hypothetical protein WG908_03435 [Sphingobium sp. AN641]|uniref:hypothetical protein n=1 Tax=Sphingobium sp. AN641 TaxID=3133443 RepID=UPI0030C04F22
MIDAVQLRPIAGDPCIMWTGIEDMQRPIRRIFRLEAFREILRSGQMTLTAPHVWDDPQEDPVAHCMMDGLRIGKHPQQSLSAYLAPAWAQCWSLNPGSDTLLRAYSRVRIDNDTRRNRGQDEEGVIVKTTPHRMIQAMKGWHQAKLAGHLVIGKVQYNPANAIGDQIVRIVHSDYGPQYFRTVQGRADSLIWKRDYFAHEQEVRILNIVAEPGDVRPDFLPMPINPNEVFEEISFDPRLISFERMEREREIKELGFAGSITHDLSYMRTEYLIPMEREWAAP